jgi:hypothetical protein
MVGNRDACHTEAYFRLIVIFKFGLAYAPGFDLVFGCVFLFIDGWKRYYILIVTDVERAEGHSGEYLSILDCFDGSV